IKKKWWSVLVVLYLQNQKNNNGDSIISFTINPSLSNIFSFNPSSLNTLQWFKLKENQNPETILSKGSSSKSSSWGFFQVEIPKVEPKFSALFLGFTKTAEIWNSRACMIGLIGTFIVELVRIEILIPFCLIENGLCLF
ncbi:hypothetical protein GIB67_033984, partial [Kingdonia uniflora]